MSSWDTPDAPLPLPEPALYDARSIVPLRSVDGAATRNAATCQACIAIRRRKKVEHPHSLVWGEGLRAIPPPPEAEEPLPSILPDEHPPEDEAEDNSEEEAMFGESPLEIVPAPAPEDELIEAEIDRYDAQYNNLYASSVCVLILRVMLLAAEKHNRCLV